MMKLQPNLPPIPLVLGPLQPVFGPVPVLREHSCLQAILDDPKALMTAFAEAEKAADWVMQRHPIQLEAAAKQAAEGQGMALTHGSDVGVIQTREMPIPAHPVWPMPVGIMQGSEQGVSPMP